MAESTTIARPYAKAIFEHALKEKQLAQWSEQLLGLAQAVLDPQVSQFIGNPATTVAQHSELLKSVCSSEKNSTLNNLIDLLATNKRLMLLPEIKPLFEVHRAEQEKTLEVQVVSFSEVSAAQQKELIKSLSERLGREVSLNIRIDANLLGGAVIQAGDLVIDGSVRGKLNKLSTGLAA